MGRRQEERVERVEQLGRQLHLLVVLLVVRLEQLHLDWYQEAAGPRRSLSQHGIKTKRIFL